MTEDPATGRVPHPPASVHAAFARQAAATPAATAVSFPGRRLDYAELDTHANRVAHALRRLGVTSQTPVGVYLDRSPELVIALLAILKAGGHYLALDPGQPPERTALLLRDSGAEVVMTRSGPHACPESPATPILMDDLDRFREHPATPPPDESGPDHTAYLAYTSGSTGRPKGVQVPHRAVLRLVRDNDFLTVGPGDTVLHLAPVAFDASTLELWAPLLNGARLAVHPPGDTTPEGVTEAVVREGVTALWLTAGLFHQIADGPLEPLSGVRQLLAGGDVLSARHVNRVLAGLPGLRLVNGYGPTENTTFTCCHVMTAPVTGDTVPIGRAIRGTEVHLLDEQLRPVPDGETGEVYAGGVGVADGYLGQPARTAERFLPDPYATRPGARLYRTGDLARRVPGGALEFLGRVDDQTKIRGFRVEPGEVEAAVRRCAEVADCAVVTQGETPGSRRLVLFATGERPLDIPALRRELAATLPAYAVPSAIVQLDALPLTPNGKVDRRALTALRTRERPECAAPLRLPAGEPEQWLAQLWSDLLEIDGVGVDDDFFELGGHSLMATAITGEIARTHGVLVTARAFYENPTIAELALLITALRTPARHIPAGHRPQ